ncbi:unnamed protein product [Rangifer tarandus platyrhynchus]|uniref:Uncharacterized protein n=1 Tax=Rangifer tarandus platyrhynchus TaxID=3082113 RepID=A0AC59YV39_RANTA
MSPGKWGCVRVQGGVARVRSGSSRPALLVQTAGPRPQLPREPWPGSRTQRRKLGDILDTGLGQQAWLRAAQARGGWHASHPVQPGLWGPVCSPGGWAGILPGAWLGRPSASRAPPLLF